MSAIRFLPESGFVAVPWKNGLGTTADIAREPASGAAFVWRLSLATIDREAAFSPYPGHDRTFFVVAGGGVELEFADGETMVSRRPGEMLRFEGERGCIGRPLAGATRDFNVITRRDAARHAVSVMALDPAGERIAAAADRSFVVALEGAIEATGDGFAARLEPFDAIAIAGPGPALTLRPERASRIALVEIELAAGE